jgi:hypothetical protein
MSGNSPVSASEDQRAALMVLAGSRDRGEADRARAIPLMLSGWTSPRIAEAQSRGIPARWLPKPRGSGDRIARRETTRSLAWLYSLAQPLVGRAIVRLG